MDTERVGTHFTNCWKDGGYRHYACAVAEAERLREALEAIWRMALEMPYPKPIYLSIEVRDSIAAALGEEAAHGDH